MPVCVSQARNNELAVEDMDGGTISNGGVFGSLFGTPILNPPQSAILGMHGIVQRPVAVHGKVGQKAVVLPEPCRTVTEPRVDGLAGGGVAHDVRGPDVPPSARGRQRGGHLTTQDQSGGGGPQRAAAGHVMLGQNTHLTSADPLRSNCRSKTLKPIFRASISQVPACFSGERVNHWTSH